MINIKKVKDSCFYNDFLLFLCFYKQKMNKNTKFDNTTKK